MFRIAFVSLVAVGLGVPRSSAAEPFAPREGNWIARDFRFRSGETLPEVRLHYRTLGAPENDWALRAGTWRAVLQMAVPVPTG